MAGHDDLYVEARSALARILASQIKQHRSVLRAFAMAIRGQPSLRRKLEPGSTEGALE
jgi:hypothetical protein